MWICNILGHSYRQLDEKLHKFSKTTFFCKRCADRQAIEYFDPTEKAGQKFQWYWDEQKIPFSERVEEWSHRCARVLRTKFYNERTIKRRFSYEYNDEGQLVPKTE